MTEGYRLGYVSESDVYFQARFYTYQIPLKKRALNIALRLTHVRERKLAVPPFRLFRFFQIARFDSLASRRFAIAGRDSNRA